MSDIDEGDTDYAGLFCKGCGLLAHTGENSCEECGLSFPENLVTRSPYSGKPEPHWRPEPLFVPEVEEKITSLRLAFVGGSLRGDLAANVRVLEDLTWVASSKGFLPMCFARASLQNRKLWETSPGVLEDAQLLVDGIVEQVARTGGAFFVRQRDDGTYSEGTTRELRIFMAAAKHAEALGLAPEIRAYRLNKRGVRLEFKGSFHVNNFVLPP